MTKKMMTFIIIILVIIVTGVSVYYFLTRNPKDLNSEESVVWKSGVFYDPVVEFDYPLYPGSKFVFDYSRPPLLARYYIAPAKEGEVAQFYKGKLENFEVTQDIFTSNSLHFTMSNAEMMKYGEENKTSGEAVERFGDGGLMTVEVGRAPFPFWSYAGFNTRRGDATEETMIVFWFFYPKEF